jgi:hypothetical protein
MIKSERICLRIYREKIRKYFCGSGMFFPDVIVRGRFNTRSFKCHDVALCNRIS